MTHVTKITKNHFFSSLTRNLAKYIFFTKINFLFKFFINSNFLIMCNILVMCNLHMICKVPIFPCFILKLNIHHISNITLHIHIIKMYVNSNYFELTTIVHIIVKITLKHHISSFSTISPKNMQISHQSPFGEFPAKFPLNFPLGKNLAQFPFTFSDQIKNPCKLTDSVK